MEQFRVERTEALLRFLGVAYAGEARKSDPAYWKWHYLENPNTRMDDTSSVGGELRRGDCWAVGDDSGAGEGRWRNAAGDLDFGFYCAGRFSRERIGEAVGDGGAGEVSDDDYVGN